MTDSDRFAIINDPHDDDVKEFQKGLLLYNMEVTNQEFNSPQPWINLVLKDHEGTVVGGILTSTLYWSLYLEVLWVDERYRGQGYGRDLLIHAEQLAKEKGCIAGQTACFSFQNLDFMRKQGYETYGDSDGYPNDVKEYFLFKMF